MSIFPTKILLAIDASEDTILAALIATDLASCTEADLHVVPRLASHALTTFRTLQNPPEPASTAATLRAGRTHKS